VPDAQPLELPQLDPADVELLNELTGVRRPLAWTSGGTTYVVRWTPAPRACSGIAAAVACGPDRAWLTCADWNQWPDVAALAAGASLTTLPPTVAQVLLNAAFEAPLEQLAAAMGGPCAVSEVTPVERLPTALHRLGLECVDDQGATIVVALAASRELLQLLRRRLEPLPLAPVRDCATLPLQSVVEVGATHLSWELLRSLRVGDAVLLDEGATPDAWTGRVSFGPHATWRVALAEGVATLQTRDVVATAPSEQAPSAPARLQFSQGRIVLTASAAAALAPGETLPWTDADRVEVRVDDRLVGYGEPLALGPRLAIRLTAWTNPSD
jgi:flagellar motor switch/type III secretory pathway protein FliN